MKREIRYIVIKIEDAEHLTYQQQVQLDEILKTIREGRERNGRKETQYVVVGHDWPMYESTWQAIERWVDGLSSPPPVVEGVLLMEIVRAMEAKLIKTESFGEAFKNGVRNMADLIELELENIEVHGNTRTASAPATMNINLKELERWVRKYEIPGELITHLNCLREAVLVVTPPTAEQADGGGA